MKKLTHYASSLLAAAVCGVTLQAAPSDPTCFTVQASSTGFPSYFDATIGNEIYDTWCVDTDRSIYRGVLHTARVVPFGDPDVAQLFDRPDAVQNLDLVLYIINQRYPGRSSVSDGLWTQGDVQRAIWHLLEDVQSTSLIAPWSQLRVNEIIADAQANGEGFVPDCGQTTVDFLVPVIAGTCDLTTSLTAAVAQILIIERPVECASIGNFVWYDENANGIQDNGELGIGGVKVELLDCNGNVVAFMDTDANGYYGFTGLTPGDYNIRVSVPAGYAFTAQDQSADDAVDSDADANGNMICTELSPGENDDTWDAGLYLMPASIGNFVWNDNNANGIQDNGELGIGGVKVELLDCNGNVVAFTGTDANGYYAFTGLTPGQYNVRVSAPAGYVFTAQDQSADDAVDSDADANGNMICTELSPGENDDTWDAGLYLRRASIGNFVWNDSNANGIQDNGELGIGGVKVELLDCNGNVVAFTGTDANGYYAFTGLTPGQYNVRVSAPAGYVFTAQDQSADDAVDSDADANGNMICTELSPGENDNSWDAGLYLRRASIGNFVWNDSNANGIQDSGELGIKGVKVELLDCNGNVVAFTSTDANGYYGFTGLTPGQYNVRVSAPAGYAFTAQDQSADDAVDSDADANGNMICTELSPGENDDSWDAGLYLRPASIGNFVWNDSNANGIQDNGELGIKGVKVELLDCNGNVVAFTSTDANGYYAFTGLTPGQYNVRVSAPAGYVFTARDQSANDAVDSDADANGNMICTELSPGENDNSWDAGLYLKFTNPGTGTPGYWKNHPQAWPVNSITIGGVSYSREAAINIMNQSVSGDVTYTLFRALVCAKLNVLIGNDSSCVSATIAAADAWFVTYGPPGSKVKASSNAWRVGEPLYLTLDKYNNGLLCAPHRN